jgi:hypothetical protein
MNKKVEAWLYGLFSGFIGGGATSGSAWLGMSAAHSAGVDVPSLNLKALGIIFLSAGVTSAMAYLAKSPLPQVVQSTTESVSVTTKTESTPVK